jgi:hypothetical protein
MAVFNISLNVVNPKENRIDRGIPERFKDMTSSQASAIIQQERVKAEERKAEYHKSTTRYLLSTIGIFAHDNNEESGIG